jgi:PTS system nitrogen regulatory IIA component
MPNDGYSTDHEVMTAAEIAEYLQLAEKTVLRMAQSGRIPAAKVASQWRFMRSVVRDWLAAQMQMTPSAATDAAGAVSREMLAPAEVIRPDLMSLNIAPGPKEQVLGQLVAPLAATGFAADPPRLLRGLIERERMMTTAVGHGIALPHPRRPIPGMFREPALAIGVCGPGCEFGAIDDRLVHVLFLICATREEIHLQMMATVSWLSRRPGVIDKLRAATTPQEVIAIVGEEKPT